MGVRLKTGSCPKSTEMFTKMYTKSARTPTAFAEANIPDVQGTCLQSDCTHPFGMNLGILGNNAPASGIYRQ